MGYALPHKVPGRHTPDSVCQVQNDTVSYPQTDTNGDMSICRSQPLEHARFLKKLPITIRRKNTERLCLIPPSPFAEKIGSTTFDQWVKVQESFDTVNHLVGLVRSIP